MANDIYFSKNKNQNSSSPKKDDSYVEKLEKAQNTNKKADHGNKKPVKKKKEKKCGTLKKILAIFLALIIIFTGGICALGGFVLKNYTSAPLVSNAFVDESSLMNTTGVTNILLMGVDNMDTSVSTRSDSMILLSLDTVHGKIKLTSFMRDMYVFVPGYYNTKLTHACQYGGPQLTVDTIEYNFNIDIDGYVKIGYEILIELVDAIGGITVDEITQVESTALAREKVYIDPGTDIHLDGTQTLQYCRIRKGQSDFQRTQRQRKVLSLIINELLKTSPVTLVSIASELIEKVECSMSKSELLSLMFKALVCIVGGIEQASVPADGTWSNATKNSMAVLVVDFDKNIDFLERFIYKNEDVDD